MKILNIVPSKVDKTIKFIIQLKDGLIIELSYINKDDGKDIICVPSQTSCNMGCKFCHITKIQNKLILRNLTDEEILSAVNLVYNNLNLDSTDKTLLISYMGLGEPLRNIENVVSSMNLLEHLFLNTQFAVATALPSVNIISEFNKFIGLIKQVRSPVKLHLSLHYTENFQRLKWMPNTTTIIPAIFLLDKYRQATKNKVEIHYTLIEGVNDTDSDIVKLSSLLKYNDISVKFLYYNSNDDNLTNSGLNRAKEFIKVLHKNEITSKYYIPPGLDVGASCGQFFEESYLKYNSKEARKNG